VFGLVTVGLAGCGGGEGEGPLTGDPSITMSGGPALPGQWVSTTISTARLRGSKNAVLDSVTPVEPNPKAVHLRYAYLVPGHGGPGAIRGWPPRGYRLKPLAGAVIRPGFEAAIVVGMSSRRIGNWQVPVFAVHYHVDSKHYVAVFHQGLRIRVMWRCDFCR
jgi:hypothetical protein